jgi:hypothetical protein
MSRVSMLALADDEPTDTVSFGWRKVQAWSARFAVLDDEFAAAVHKDAQGWRWEVSDCGVLLDVGHAGTRALAIAGAEAEAQRLVGGGPVWRAMSGRFGVCGWEARVDVDDGWLLSVAPSDHGSAWWWSISDGEMVVDGIEASRREAQRAAERAMTAERRSRDES